MSLEGSVKLEPEWESESEATAAPLFVAVKEELDLGPELLQPPDVVYALQDIVKREPKAHVQAVPGVTASVVLEPMLVDLKSETCTVGLQTYDFQLHHENQESQEISSEEYEIKDIVKGEPKAPVQAVPGVTASVGLEPMLGDLKSETCTVGLQTYSYDFQLHHENQESVEISLEEYEIKGQARFLAAKKTKSAKTRKPKGPVEEKKAKPNEKIAKRTQKPAGSSSSSGVNTLTAETNFKCEKCGKSFNIQSDLEKHFNTHMLLEASTSRKASKFTCKTCNCIFDTKLLLQEHEKSRHGVKYFACDECEYATTHASHLQTHLRTHTGEKPFKCSQCSSVFSHGSSLQRHLETHTREKPFKCSQCCSAFSHSSSLQRHLVTHTGEKPFKCIQCSSAFSQSSHLQSHLRTHTREKPFKCRQCSSTFATGSGLRVHLRKHSGEKPFECNICDYKTAESGHLKDHLMSRHSGQKPFGCDACSYRGATRGNVRRHMKRCHKPA